MLNTTITAIHNAESESGGENLASALQPGFALSEQNAFGAQRMASGGEILRAPASAVPMSSKAPSRLWPRPACRR
jgi:hypothetical protein